MPFDSLASEYLWLKNLSNYTEKMADAPAKHIPLQDELPSLIEMLRTPAGDDARFATRELIAANHDAFREICHTVWKEVHPAG